MKKLVFTLASAIILAGCTPDSPPAEGIVISDLRVQAPMGGQTMSAGYFEITNHSSVDDAIIDVESAVAKRVEMHKTENVDGIMKMRRQVSVDLKAGETLNFAPGGYHLMLFGVDLSKDQTDAAVTLKFKHAPDVTIIADIAESAVHTGHH